MAKVVKRRITEYQYDKRNANRHTERGMGMLEKSVSELGMGRSILVDKEGRIIAGNATHETAVDVGIEDVIEVETDGNTLVVVKRVDLDLESDAKARRLAFADNRVSDVNLEWSATAIAAEIEAGIDLSDMFTPAEIADIAGAEVMDVDLSGASAPIAEAFNILVECRDEAHQRELLAWLAGEGLKCRALIS